MENKNEQSTASSLLRFAGPYKGRYALSICLSVLGVASGLVPYYAAAQMLIGLIGTERSFSFYIFWGIVAAVGYLAKSTFAILSTSVSHTATFLALRDIRKQIVDKFSRMPMGTLLNTPSGQLKIRWLTVWKDWRPHWLICCRKCQQMYWCRFSLSFTCSCLIGVWH